MKRVLALALALLAGAAACSKDGDQGGQRPSRPVPVVVAPVVERSAPVEVRAVGTVEAKSSSDVIAQVGGEIQKVHFHAVEPTE